MKPKKVYIANKSEHACVKGWALNKFFLGGTKKPQSNNGCQG